MHASRTCVVYGAFIYYSASNFVKQPYTSRPTEFTIAAISCVALPLATHVRFSSMLSITQSIYIKPSAKTIHKQKQERNKLKKKKKSSPRFIKDVILMSSDTLPPEKCREPLSDRYLVL